MKKITILLFSILFLSSCVTSKKYKELEALSDKYLSDKQDFENKLDKSASNLEDCTNEKQQLLDEVAQLKMEKSGLELTKKQLEKEIDDYKRLSDDLASSNNSLITEASAKQQQLSAALSLKEKELALVSAQQEALDQKLKDREAEVNAIQKENAIKSTRIKELEDKLKAKDQAIKDLKDKINLALKGFSSDEIQVVEKNGNLYVSLSENLLFKSGSFSVDKKGEDALLKLAEVLKKQEDFNILVEGHTDDDPFNGSGLLLDNWDLSVKRATSVVRILTGENGIASNKIAASGRGEYIPVTPNDSKVNKAKNRRTEIILSPKLDKIFDLLNQN